MLNNIQIIRFISALFVIIFHCVEKSQSYGLEATYLDFFMNIGAGGVDVFFVISGALMIIIQSHKKKSPFVFFKDRLLRIYPLYCLFTIAICSVLIFIPHLFREMTFSASWGVSSLLLVSKFFSGQSPVVNVGWTLELELIFYTVFSCSIFFRNIKYVLIVTSLVILVIAITLGSSYLIMIEFIYGMIIGYIFIKRPSISLVFGFFCLIVGFLLFLSSAFHKFDEQLRFLYWGGPAFIIVFGAFFSAQSTGRLGQWMSSLGSASYSIYLVQVISIPLAYKVFSRYVNMSEFNGDVLVLVSSIITIILGCFVYLFVEKKILFWKILYNKAPVVKL